MTENANLLRAVSSDFFALFICFIFKKELLSVKAIGNEDFFNLSKAKSVIQEFSILLMLRCGSDQARTVEDLEGAQDVHIQLVPVARSNYRYDSRGCRPTDLQTYLVDKNSNAFYQLSCSFSSDQTLLLSKRRMKQQKRHRMTYRQQRCQYRYYCFVDCYAVSQIRARRCNQRNY